jgi:hypothetical protein
MPQATRDEARHCRSREHYPLSRSDSGEHTFCALAATWARARADVFRASLAWPPISSFLLIGLDYGAADCLCLRFLLYLLN